MLAFVGTVCCAWPNKLQSIRTTIPTNAYERKRQKALEIIRQLSERSKHAHVDPGNFADIFVALGDKELPRLWLNLAQVNHTTL
jgi:hypothetical protein